MNKTILYLAISAFIGGCFITSLYYKEKINIIERKIKQDEYNNLKNINDYNNKINVLNDKLKEKEKQSYEKIKSMEEINDQHLRDIDDLNIRLFVKTRSTSICPKVSKGGATSVSNETTTREELDPRDARRIIEITKKADTYKTQLEELQKYIIDYNKNIDVLNNK